MNIYNILFIGDNMEDIISKELGIEKNNRKHTKKGHKDDFFILYFLIICYNDI